MLAFAARYGSQPPTAALGRMLTMTEWAEFNEALGAIIREEADAVRRNTNS